MHTGKRAGDWKYRYPSHNKITITPCPGPSHAFPSQFPHAHLYRNAQSFLHHHTSLFLFPQAPSPRSIRPLVTPLPAPPLTYDTASSPESQPLRPLLPRASPNGRIVAASVSLWSAPRLETPSPDAARRPFSKDLQLCGTSHRRQQKKRIPEEKLIIRPIHLVRDRLSPSAGQAPRYGCISPQQTHTSPALSSAVQRSAGSPSYRPLVPLLHHFLCVYSAFLRLLGLVRRICSGLGSLFTPHINTSSVPPPFFSSLSLPRNFCPTLRSACLWPLFYSRYRSIAHISSKTGTPLDLHTDRFCDRPPEAPVLATANEPERPIAIHQNVVGYLCSGNGHSNLHVMVEAPTA